MSKSATAASLKTLTGLEASISELSRQQSSDEGESDYVVLNERKRRCFLLALKLLQSLPEDSSLIPRVTKLLSPPPAALKIKEHPHPIRIRSLRVLDQLLRSVYIVLFLLASTTALLPLLPLRSYILPFSTKCRNMVAAFCLYIWSVKVPQVPEWPSTETPCVLLFSHSSTLDSFVINLLPPQFTSVVKVSPPPIPILSARCSLRSLVILSSLSHARSSK